jgi:hypothetical protein
MDILSFKIMFLWVCLVTLVGIMATVVYLFGMFTTNQFGFVRRIEDQKKRDRTVIYGGVFFMICFFIVMGLTIIFI